MNTERLTELRESLELSRDAFIPLDEEEHNDLLSVLGDYEAALPLLEAVRKKPGGDLIEEIRLMDNQPVYNDSSLLCAALAYVEKVLLKSSRERPEPQDAKGENMEHESLESQREMLNYFDELYRRNEEAQRRAAFPDYGDIGIALKIRTAILSQNLPCQNTRQNSAIEPPPVGTTDGTLTFKMPQATTAPPEPGEEEGRGALKILDDYFGGATFDSAIFGTDDGGPIDEAREKLQKSWDCLRSLILAPATAAVRVTRGEVVAMLMTASGHIGIETSRVDDGVRWLREKGIIVEEGEEKP